LHVAYQCGIINRYSRSNQYGDIGVHAPVCMTCRGQNKEEDGFAHPCSLTRLAETPPPQSGKREGRREWGGSGASQEQRISNDIWHDASQDLQNQDGGSST